jgi:1,4-alpha-glucan branching enzyme
VTATADQAKNGSTGVRRTEIVFPLDISIYELHVSKLRHFSWREEVIIPTLSYGSEQKGPDLLS